MAREQTRTFGYLCPACHRRVVRSRSRFALEASGAVIACDCGKSNLTVESDGLHFRLAVPCGICGGEHTAELPTARLFDGEGVGFACPETKQLCGFAGEAYAVERELERLSLTAEKERGQEGREAFTDNVIMYEVLSELKEIAAREHGITCACGSERYRMEVRSAHVDLICAACGAKLRIGAATDEDLDRLCCHLTLKIGGR